MSNQTLTLAQEITSMKAVDVIRHEVVRQQFIDVYNAIWKEGGEGIYEREANYFLAQMRASDKLRKCTAMSVFLSFIDLAVKDLSLEPGAQALCYLTPRNYNTGKKDDKGYNIYEMRCSLIISGYGELMLRIKAGQIMHADNPVVVYEGDEFSFGERDGRKYVNYCCCIPKKSNKIIACFIKITRCDGSVDYSVMLESDWKRLEDYSAKNNSYYDAKTRTQVIGKANALYDAGGQIDIGFLKAKCIKHAFKTYPKIAIGKGSQLESDAISQQQEPEFNPYGMAETEMDAAQQQTFAEPKDMSAGVTVDPSQNNADDDGVF